MKRVLYALVAWVLIGGALAGCGPTATPATTAAAPATTEAPAQTGEKTLILATTTSTQDSGLLDYLLPEFEKQFGVSVSVIAVGTGEALQMGQDGNADVLLVHARAKEDQFMADGHGVRREDVMYNDFVIVGPASDPAGIKGMRDAAKAFKKIADVQQPFLSRGDESGTHTKEKSVWKAAGIEPAGDWYLSTGQGMGDTLNMAQEKQGYTLSDRATYLARTQSGLELALLVEGDAVLFNPYGVIAVNPEKSEKIQNALANQFIDWLISMPTQEMIGKFGVDKFGAPLFTPDSQAWRDAHAETSGGDAALKITGKVTTEMAWTEEEVKAMETMEAESTNKNGETSTYTGVSLAALLAMAGPASDAATVVYVADDGYTAEVPLADVLACPTCIVSFRNQGGFSTVMPDFPGNLQVKGVIEIQVK